MQARRQHLVRNTLLVAMSFGIAAAAGLLRNAIIARQFVTGFYEGPSPMCVRYILKTVSNVSEALHYLSSQQICFLDSPRCSEYIFH